MAATAIHALSFPSASISIRNPPIFLRRHSLVNLKPFSRRDKHLIFCAASMGEFSAHGDSSRGETGERRRDSSQYEALLKGGEQVTSVLEEMVTLVSLLLLLLSFLLLRSSALILLLNWYICSVNGCKIVDCFFFFFFSVLLLCFDILITDREYNFCYVCIYMYACMSDMYIVSAVERFEHG